MSDSAGESMRTGVHVDAFNVYYGARFFAHQLPDPVAGVSKPVGW
ncbi:hypothetical protein FHS23_000524 [Prauserella isguenensis]|uniref:Uncharacterized protein n=1 Tax=Prauserella isguenensis TaxID=1470180 RepID=A0A839RY37_9PSEU|nr:hypothetical protein [Prauserella isguenensis]MBB3049529.1 hypothetical protein [Prauserella isguenensis]